MTKQENKILKLTSDLFNEAIALPEEHPADNKDIEFHIHAIQNIILAREGLRSLKKKK